MKRLVIHPKDKSTEFLSDIYEGLENTTVITGGVTKPELAVLIHEHDQILMLGHGSPHGLFSVGQFPHASNLLIDDSFAPLLRDKSNVFVWCHADQFVEYNALNGFSTGMFISEVSEARFCGVADATYKDVTESNAAFAAALNVALMTPVSADIPGDVAKAGYKALAEKNRVAAYNFNRLKQYTDQLPVEMTAKGCYNRQSQYRYGESNGLSSDVLSDGEWWNENGHYGTYGKEILPGSHDDLTDFWSGAGGKTIAPKRAALPINSAPKWSKEIPSPPSRSVPGIRKKDRNDKSCQVVSDRSKSGSVGESNVVINNRSNSAAKPRGPKGSGAGSTGANRAEPRRGSSRNRGTARSTSTTGRVVPRGSNCGTDSER